MATHPSQNKMMKAAHLTQFCAEGTVADAILFGDVPTPRAPSGDVVKKSEAPLVPRPPSPPPPDLVSEEL